MEWGHEFLSCTIDKFKDIKSLGERTITQLSLEELHWSPSPESNSIAVLVRHLSGNMIARWTDFLKSDGEKQNRDRDAEFEGVFTSREELLAAWESGWKALFDALSALSSDDLLQTVTIRDEPHSVIKAIQRQVSHYSYHVGQIVYAGKQQKDQSWSCLSVPRGKSKEYTEQVRQTNRNTQ